MTLYGKLLHPILEMLGTKEHRLLLVTPIYNFGKLVIYDYCEIVSTLVFFIKKS